MDHHTHKSTQQLHVDSTTVGEKREKAEQTE